MWSSPCSTTLSPPATIPTADPVSWTMKPLPAIPGYHESLGLDRRRVQSWSWVSDSPHKTDPSGLGARMTGDDHGEKEGSIILLWSIWSNYSSIICYFKWRDTVSPGFRVRTRVSTLSRGHDSHLRSLSGIVLAAGPASSIPPLLWGSLLAKKLPWMLSWRYSSPWLLPSPISTSLTQVFSGRCSVYSGAQCWGVAGFPRSFSTVPQS